MNQRNRQADRERFPDPAFNRWLDEGISDAGHTVWDQIGDVCSAWHGWVNSALYLARSASENELQVSGERSADLPDGAQQMQNDENPHVMSALNAEDLRALVSDLSLLVSRMARRLRRTGPTVGDAGDRALADQAAEYLSRKGSSCAGSANTRRKAGAALRTDQLSIHKESRAMEQAKGKVPVCVRDPRRFGETDAAYWSRQHTRLLEAESVLRAQVSALRASHAELKAALEDMLAGWRYIRQNHGDLYGVGWDRCEESARSALAAAKELS